jgi:chromosome partitioning protein
MAKVITVTNQKGGVGKTTIAAHLAFALQESGHSVLFVDIDGQGHGSIYISADKTITSRRGGAERIFEGEEGLRGIATASGVDLLHGHLDLGKLDKGHKTSKDAFALRDYVRGLAYDFIVIDTPPALQLRQFAAMIWADILVVVAEPEEKALRGFLKVKEVINLLQKKEMLPGNYEWRILFNKVDQRIAEQQKVLEGFTAQFQDRVVPVVLSERKALVNKSYSARVPMWKFKETPKELGAIWRSLPHLIGALS